MVDVEVNNTSSELLPSNFKFHDFNVDVGQVRLAGQIIVMQDSLFLWIGDSNEGKLNDLSFGFMSNYEKIPVATKLMGSMDDITSSNIAKRLTKKCGIPVYISFNTVVNNTTLLAIEKSIHEELKKYPEILSSFDN